MSKAALEKELTKLGPKIHITRRIEGQIKKILSGLQDLLKDDPTLMYTLVYHALILGKGIFEEQINEIIEKAYSHESQVEQRTKLLDLIHQLDSLICGDHDLIEVELKKNTGGLGRDHVQIYQYEEYKENLRTEIEEEVSKISGVELSGGND